MGRSGGNPGSIMLRAQAIHPYLDNQYRYYNVIIKRAQTTREFDLNSKIVF